MIALGCMCRTLPAAENNTLTPAEAAAGWHLLFDGKSLDGWRANELQTVFTVADGQIVVKGPRTHLFYAGPFANHDFKNFELSAEIMTRPKANSGVYFHTEWQQNGWPAKGYEVQVNNSHEDTSRTAGLYAIKDNLDAVAQDNQWFTMQIRVEAPRIVVSVNDKVVTDYSEPKGSPPSAKCPLRRLDHGTIALQGHDPRSEVHYRNIKIRLLP
ncbi:MAG TPA: DUF1080 domain-containing protein [Anaerolineales bacterium]|nr:DUF1080 domain-containing protein [Anaerolineales bacterium]